MGLMMLSRIGRSLSRSAGSSFLHANLGSDAAKTSSIANQYAGFASRTENGLGFLNPYSTSIAAANQPFSSVSNPNFAIPSFARFFSTAIPNDTNHEVKGVKGEDGLKSLNVLRPLSPHLTIYQPQSNSIFSILNRVSGMYLTGSSLLFSLVYMQMGSICLTFPSFHQAVFYLSKLDSIALEIAAVALPYYVYHVIHHREIDGVKQILADYVHSDMTRTGIMVAWRLFLVIIVTNAFLCLANLK